MISKRIKRNTNVINLGLAGPRQAESVWGEWFLNADCIIPHVFIEAFWGFGQTQAFEHLLTNAKPAFWNC